jgi:hypothetical protein
MCKFEMTIRKVKEISMERLHEFFSDKLKIKSMLDADYPSDVCDGVLNQ